MNLKDLAQQKCKPLKGKEHQLTATGARELLAALPDWELDEAHIHKQFKFADFVHALAFVNALGYIAEQQNHHPDLELGWGRCVVKFSTHDVGGLSMNDFICAAKTEVLSAG